MSVGMCCGKCLQWQRFPWFMFQSNSLIFNYTYFMHNTLKSKEWVIWRQINLSKNMTLSLLRNRLCNMFIWATKKNNTRFRKRETFKYNHHHHRSTHPFRIFALSKILFFQIIHSFFDALTAKKSFCVFNNACVLGWMRMMMGVYYTHWSSTKEIKEQSEKRVHRTAMSTCLLV